jgi:hypothetical protein
MLVFLQSRNSRLMKESTTPFLLSLALSDFIFCAFNLPLTAARWAGTLAEMNSSLECFHLVKTISLYNKTVQEFDV